MTRNCVDHHDSAEPKPSLVGRLFAEHRAALRLSISVFVGTDGRRRWGFQSPWLVFFARLRASAPQVRRLNKAFIDVLHLLVRWPCESLIDVRASVFICIDLLLPVVSVRI
jgi:hypothetical protein